MRRLPRGYKGIKHETIGSDILAVMGSLKLPALTLGKDLSDRLAQVQPTEWYPIELLLEAMDKIAERVGPDGLRQMGRLLFAMSHKDRVGPASAREILYGFDAMYHHANRGTDIGGWKVLSFGVGKASLEKNTPHHCVMEEGIMSAALAAVGVPATIAQSSCLRAGAETCVFDISSVVVDQRWAGKA